MSEEPGSMNGNQKKTTQQKRRENGQRIKGWSAVQNAAVFTKNKLSQGNEILDLIFYY